MRKHILTFTLLIAMLAVPATAMSQQGLDQQHPKHTQHSRTIAEIYTARYFAVKKQTGKAPGRNIRRHGVSNGRKATRAELAQSARRLRRMLHTPKAPAWGGGGAGGELASIRACESGGNYATNTHNGFSGAYQFDNQTWKAAGGSTAEAWQASPAEQDRVAAHWIASGHRGAWPNC